MTDASFKLQPSDLHFILVRPVFLGNIGSIARLMKNFGFANLRLVEAPRNYKDAEARKMSVGAFDVLKASTTFQTVPEATEDMHLVIGTSSGQQRNQTLMSLSEVIERVCQTGAHNKIAIVLGDERNGLSNEELSQCHLLTRIDTNPDFAAMNVALAAGIIAYEFSKISTPYKGVATTGSSNLPSANEQSELFEQLGQLLEQVEFSRSFNKTLVIKELRRFYDRATPSKRECDLLRGVLHKLNQALALKR